MGVPNAADIFVSVMSGALRGAYERRRENDKLEFEAQQQAAREQAARQAQMLENQRQRTFQGGENEASRDLTASEGALDRQNRLATTRMRVNAATSEEDDPLRKMFAADLLRGLPENFNQNGPVWVDSYIKARQMLGLGVRESMKVANNAMVTDLANTHPRTKGLDIGEVAADGDTAANAVADALGMDPDVLALDPNDNYTAEELVELLPDILPSSELQKLDANRLLWITILENLTAVPPGPSATSETMKDFGERERLLRGSQMGFGLK